MEPLQGLPWVVGQDPSWGEGRPPVFFTCRWIPEADLVHTGVLCGLSLRIPKQMQGSQNPEQGV